MGNTRLHWAYIQPRSIEPFSTYHHWNTAHLQEKDGGDEERGGEEEEESIHGIPKAFLIPFVIQEILQNGPFALFIASVVPNQSALWTTRCPYAKVVSVEMVLEGLEDYKTLGVDRALALRGAGELFGWPCMVIDAGTALTFTCGDDGGRLIGGAILPGLRLSMISLNSKTAMLPQVPLPSFDNPFPIRFATSTPGAIQSGVVYGALATIQDFTEAFHHAEVLQGEKSCSCVLTGGDAALLHAALKRRQEAAAGAAREASCSWELQDDLTFRGLHWVVRAQGWIQHHQPLPRQAQSTTDNI